MEITATPEQQSSLRVPPNTSLHTAMLIEFIRNADKAGTTSLTDEDMTAQIKKDTKVGGAGYGYLHSAIRYLEREDGIVWARLRGAWCIQKQDAKAIVERSAGGLHHLRRSSRRHLLRLRCVDSEQLADGDKAIYQARTALFFAITGMSSTQTQKKLEARSVSTEPSLVKLLEAMK